MWLAGCRDAMEVAGYGRVPIVEIETYRTFFYHYGSFRLFV